jgi:hypothetical protein
MGVVDNAVYVIIQIMLAPATTVGSGNRGIAPSGMKLFPGL